MHHCCWKSLSLSLSLTVKEVSTTLDAIHSSMEECVPMFIQLNQLLPENERLEPFVLHPPQPQAYEEEGEGGLQESVDRSTDLS